MSVRGRFAAAITVSLCFLLSGQVLAQAWSVSRAPAGAEAGKAAKVLSSNGDSLYLWSRKKDGKTTVFAEFHLNDGRLVPHRLPKYQIDQGVPARVDRIVTAAGSSEGWARVSGKQVIWKLWEGQSSTVAAGDGLRDWLAGERIRFIYPVESGGERTAEFTLSGSSRAISSVAGLRLE